MLFDHIISLGGDCFPRVSLTKIKIKKDRSQGELSYPFDLSVTPLKNVIDMIWSDFDKFHEYKLEEVDNEILIELVNYPGTYLNHESPMKDNIFYEQEGSLYFVKDKYKKLKERYINRIDNFRKILSSEKNILFVLHLTGCTSNEDIIRLTKAIEAMYPKLEFRIVVVHLYKPVLTNVECSEKVFFYEDIVDQTWNCTENYTSALAIKLKTFMMEEVFQMSQEFPI